MRHLLLTLVLVLFCLGLQANNVLNQPTTFDQPDGSELESFVTGGEFMPHTSLPGNLEIMDVGASDNTPASGEILRVTNVWTGATSTAWTTASNWSLGVVPTSEHWVEIPGNTTRMPTLSNPGTTIYNLIIHSGGILNHHALTTLHVTNNVDVAVSTEWAFLMSTSMLAAAFTFGLAPPPVSTLSLVAIPILL